MDPCPVLVGREQELAVLRGILDAGGGVAIVSGEAGIGKSRLVREFAKEAEARGRVVLWARPEEVAQPGPYALIVDLLESIAERGSSSVKSEARSLATELTRPAVDGKRNAPAPRAVAAEVRGLIAQLGRPPLILMEDLHWADESSDSVVLHLARAAGDDHHMYVGTLRPEEAASEVSLGRLVDSLVRDRVATEIVLPSLDVQEMASMLQQLWGRNPSESELAELARVGEGIPFFIEELAGSGTLTQRGLVPKSIEQSVNARVKGLKEEAAGVLATASLTSGAIDVAVLALANDLPDERVAVHLAVAARAGLLSDMEGRLVFRHSLVREAIASGLVSVEAAKIHGRLASAIEKVHAGELDPFVGELARHYREAGQPRPAAEYAVRAGERALSFGATDEARAFFKLAFDLSNRVSMDALRGLAEVDFREGNERQAAGLFREVADELKRRGDGLGAARVLSRLAWAMQEGTNPERVVEVLEEGLRELRSVTEEVESARLVVQQGSVICFLQRDPGRARPILLGALEAATKAGDSGLVAEALDALAQVADQNGVLLEALELGDRAIEASRKSNQAEIVGRACHNHAIRLAAYGRSSSALEVLAEGRRHLHTSYGRAALGALDVSEGWVSWLMGLPDQVAHLTARGVHAWQRWRGYRWLLETWASVERSELEVADAVVAGAWDELGGRPPNDAERLSVGVAPKQDIEFALFAESLSLLSRKADRERLAHVTDELLGYENKVERFDFGQLLALRARAMIEIGELDAAKAALKTLEQLSGSHHYPYLRALWLECRARIALIEGAYPSACDGFSEAVEIFELIANSSDRVRCLRLLATALMHASGEARDSTAIQHLKAAWRLARTVGAVAEGSRVESDLRAAGVSPRAGRPRRSDADLSALSPREAEVAALVATGETNAGIAARLFLSERTVQDHIGHALRKLGLSGRAGLASWAVREGMV